MAADVRFHQRSFSVVTQASDYIVIDGTEIPTAPVCNKCGNGDRVLWFVSNMLRLLILLQGLSSRNTLIIVY